MRREIFVPSHRSSQLHKHANIQNNMNILRIFRLLCRLNKLTFPLCESTETVFTHRENPVYKSSQFPNQGESCYKHSSGSVLVYQLSLCALADQLLFNPRTVLKITWWTSYLYFNNSWSTNENMIAGRSWLILKWNNYQIFILSDLYSSLPCWQCIWGAAQAFSWTKHWTFWSRSRLHNLSICKDAISYLMRGIWVQARLFVHIWWGNAVQRQCQVAFFSEKKKKPTRNFMKKKEITWYGLIRHLSMSHRWNFTKLDSSGKFKSCLSFWGSGMYLKIGPCHRSRPPRAIGGGGVPFTTIAYKQY